MEFDNSFEVPLPPAEAWKVLLDIKRVAPCMPGAELTEVLDENTYKGKINVRLGPVALTFAGVVKFEHIDARHAIEGPSRAGPLHCARPRPHSADAVSHCVNRRTGGADLRHGAACQGDLELDHRLVPAALAAIR